MGLTMNPLCVSDRTQPVRHGDGRASLGSAVQRRLHDLLALGVKGGRGLVEKENARVA